MKIQQQNRIKWKLTARRNYKAIALYLAIAIFMFVCSRSGESTFTFTDGYAVTKYNLHLSLSVALAFLIFILLYLLSLIKTKRSFEEERIQRLKWQPTLYTASIHLTPEGINCEYFAATLFCKWQAFRYYHIGTDYLLLLAGKSYFDAVFIDRKDIADADLCS